MPAPAPNAHGIPNESATRPSAIGPKPRPMSMDALAVPDAAPRSLGLALAKIAEKNAGVLNVTPPATPTTPASSPAGVGQTAMIARPAAVTSNPAAPSGSEGRRSGTLAHSSRQATTTA